MGIQGRLPLLEGGLSKGRRESRSKLDRRARRDSTAKQTTKIPARHELTRMVMARTFTSGSNQIQPPRASHGLSKTVRILRDHCRSRQAAMRGPAGATSKLAAQFHQKASRHLVSRQPGALNILNSSRGPRNSRTDGVVYDQRATTSSSLSDRGVRPAEAE